jgi:hypothetical protein
MNIQHPDAIWFVPPILAVAFLLWVLWNFVKEDLRQRGSARAARPQPFPPTSDWGRPASNTAARDVRSPVRVHRPADLLTR